MKIKPQQKYSHISMELTTSKDLHRPKSTKEKCRTSSDEEEVEKGGHSEFMQKTKAKVEKKGLHSCRLYNITDDIAQNVERSHWKNAYDLTLGWRKMGHQRMVSPTRQYGSSQTTLFLCVGPLQISASRDKQKPDTRGAVQTTKCFFTFCKNQCRDQYYRSTGATRSNAPIWDTTSSRPRRTKTSLVDLEGEIFPTPSTSGHKTGK